MERTVYAMPAQCKRCGQLFDLSYDLEKFGEEKLLLELMRAAHGAQSALCWECRIKGRIKSNGGE